MSCAGATSSPSIRATASLPKRATSWLPGNGFRPVACELAEPVCGRVPGRSSDQQITLFKSVGTAVQDVALAVNTYRNAKAKGLGEEIGNFPFIADKLPPRIRH